MKNCLTGYRADAINRGPYIGEVLLEEFLINYGLHIGEKRNSAINQIDIYRQSDPNEEYSVFSHNISHNSTGNFFSKMLHSHVS